MTTPGLQQRCWNHEAREAVCRCPRCGRSFCRECVTEHESRLMCAACLRVAAQTVPVRRGRLRRMAGVGLTVAGLAIAWAVYLAAAEGVVTITERSEHLAWQDR